MKTLVRAALATLTLGSAAQAQLPQLALQPPLHLPSPLVICADLGVSIRASGSGGSEAQTRFVVTLSNTSSRDFVSTPGLQWVTVVLSGPFGATGPERLPFDRLNAGRSRSWTFDRQGNAWQASADLFVDPSTRFDAILSNNECNVSNNRASASY